MMGWFPASKQSVIEEIHPGICRIRLPLPGGKPDHVNAYLFKGKQPLLFDTGMNRTFKHLASALGRVGFDPADLEQLVLSHGHFDHYGAGSALVKRSKKPLAVFAHPSEAAMMARGNGLGLTPGELKTFLKKTGFPLRHRLSVVFFARLFDAFANKITATRCPDNDEFLVAGDYPAQLLVMPGHSQGVLCLYLPDQNILFTSDHVLSYLPHSDPYLFHFEGLAERLNQLEYFDSLGRVGRLAPDRIYPGHGEPIDAFEPVFEAYRREYDKKDQKILRALSRKEGTVFDVVRRVFPRVLKPTMGFSIYIAASEVYTHLQVLVKDGKAVMEERREGIVFSLAPGDFT